MTEADHAILALQNLYPHLSTPALLHTHLPHLVRYWHQQANREGATRLGYCWVWPPGLPCPGRPGHIWPGKGGPLVAAIGDKAYLFPSPWYDTLPYLPIVLRPE